jgi:hypothetical protein
MSERVPVKRTPDQLVTIIKDKLADNNSGDIGASDVREPMEDMATSIPYIVASGNFSAAGTQFINDLHLKVHTVASNAQGGTLI